MLITIWLEQKVFNELSLHLDHMPVDIAVCEHSAPNIATCGKLYRFFFQQI